MQFDNNTTMKAGKTIIISKYNNENNNETTFFNEFSTNIKLNQINQTLFIESKDINTSISLFNKLKQNNIECRYANYRMFLIIDSDFEKLSYDQIKNLIKEQLYSINPNLNILYFKLYKKDNRLTGNGHIVVDNFDDLKNIVNKIHVKDNFVFKLVNYVSKEKRKFSSKKEN